MKLTKDQRFTAYVIMLNEYEKDYYDACEGWGFCFLILQLFNVDVYQANGNGNEKAFALFLPELFKKKPATATADWFDYYKSGWAKRSKLLKQCIEETA